MTVVLDATSSDKSEVVSIFISAFALLRFRFGVGVGSGVSSGVRSPVPFTSVRFSVP